MIDNAFAQLVDAYYAPLYRFALSLARGQEEACDLTQQTFYVWASKGHTLRDLSKVKTWLFTTLYREFLKGKRRDNRFTAIADLPPGEEDPPALPVDLGSNLDSQSVIDALGQIDEKFRAPLALFYLEDLSYQEIATLLEVPIGTVMSRIARGKAKLRENLSNTIQSEDEVVQFPNINKRQIS